MKNVLFLGLGSIGQRHFRNLKKIDKNLKFFCIREKRFAPELNNKNQVIKKKFSSKKKIKEIFWSEIQENKIDTAFITNPTSLHVINAIKLAGLKINLFIEKPLSHNLSKVDKLNKIIKKNKLNCEIGFQTRYDDLLEKLKQIIISKKYGNVIKCNIEHCHYLPDHHKYENYKKSYASNKKLGGGVILCFSHEIDYAEYLFDKPKKIIPIKISKKNILNIDVESSAQFSIIYKKKLSVTFNLDFLRKKASRKCSVQFEKAFIKWDLIKNEMTIEEKIIKKIKSKTQKRNDLFLKAVKETKKCFIKSKNSRNLIENGISNLKTILMIKNAFKQNRIKNL